LPAARITMSVVFIDFVLGKEIIKITALRYCQKPISTSCLQISFSQVKKKGGIATLIFAIGGG
jgi:hypothetical protein